MGILLMMLAGWINRYQQDVIVYLKEENKILCEKRRWFKIWIRSL